MRVFVDIDKPWSTETYETCLIIDNRYIPVKHLSAMLETDTRILLNKWDPYISNKVEGCGVNRNFVQLEQLPNLLTAEGWDNDKIEKGLAYFTHSAPAPMRKRDLEEDGDEQYLKRGPTKRKEIQETIPKWAIDFMEECRKTVGNQCNVLNFRLIKNSTIIWYHMHLQTEIKINPLILFTPYPPLPSSPLCPSSLADGRASLQVPLRRPRFPS